MRIGFFILLVVSAFLSGLTIDGIGSKDGKPIMALLVSVIALVLYIVEWFRHPARQKAPLMFAIGLLLLANGTPIFSVLFLLSNLATYIVLNSFVGPVDLSARPVRIVILLMVVTMVIVVGLDFTGVDLDIWSGEKYQLNIARLRLFTNEASYLGFLAALAFVNTKKRSVKFAWLAVLAISQSAYGLVTAVLVSWRQNIVRASIGAAAVGLLVSAYLLQQDIYVYFQNSVFVRFVGLDLLVKSDFMGLLWGNGLGHSDIALEPLFALFGVESASAFLFGFLVDVGILGLLLYYMVFCRNLADAAFLSFLLLNFGASSLYIPLGMYLFQLGKLDATAPNPIAWLTARQPVRHDLRIL